MFTYNVDTSTLSVAYPKATYTVTFNGTNVTSDGESSVTEGETYTATLTAAEGYTLPETVIVTGGTADYNKETGALSITDITGDVTITAVGVAIPVEPAQEYYLVGYLNNADYNGENYKFVDGKLTVTFTADSYVAVKDASGDWYMAESYIGTGTTGTFAKGNSEKMLVPGNAELTFTLAENADGSLTLSYEKAEAEEPATKEYYLVGYLNNADYSGNDYKFENGKLTVTFTADSYVAVKDAAGDWYMAKSYIGTETTGTFAKGNSEKMLVPGNVELTFTLVENADGTLTLSYEEAKTEEPDDETGYTVNFHFANEKGWSPVNLYLWNGASTGSWPGTTITDKDENGYLTYTVESTQKALNYIFNNGSVQTVDLTVDEALFGEGNTAEVYVRLTEQTDGKFNAEASAQPFDDVTLVVSPQITGTTVTFQYAGTANTVELRGTVTGASWDKGIAMTKNDKGIWTLTVENLAPAVYEYKFVINGETWITDPANSKTNAEGNSVFTITDPNAEDKNEITLNVYYERADGIYVKKDADGEGVDGVWNAHVWGDVEKGGRYDYTEKDGKMVFTLNLPGRTTRTVYLKNRLSTEAKDWLQEEGQVTVSLDNIVSGTVNVYITSDGQNGNKGNSSYSVVTGTDIVAANKVVDVQYDYATGKVAVTTLEALTDSKDLGITNREDSTDDIAITSVSDKNKVYTLTLSKSLDLVNLYKYQITYDGYNYDIGIDSVYASDKFADEFAYEGDLGSAYRSDSTIFKVWAPTAESVAVKLYSTGSDSEDGAADLGAFEMTKGDKGVWTVTIQGDLKNVYYTYSVKVDGETVEAVDPYARATGVNGQRGMVIDLDSTDPEGWAIDRNPNPVTSQTDAVIYELHVRDFSIDDSSGITVANRGKYLAFTEEGTTVNGAGAIQSGVDYLESLGITHLHLLPVYDYGSVDETKCNTFNWGYDPVNYNVPEGSYSTDPYRGEVRVNEFKQMVKSLHDHDISVVMDVVYNHVYDADKFCFNNIVPGYFSRVNSNTSGCGNDTASEREMVRKYIVESVLYWTEEYHIDGFRFDLVGLLDVQTINQIVTEVHAVRPDVIFYGEGWDMDSTNREPGTEMAKQGNASKTPGFAYFSDSIRNGIGGSNGSSLGFASGAANGATIANDWLANPWWTTNPQQVIQYASCHDNYTLIDKLVLSTKAAGLDGTIIKMNNLAAAYYMTAQGVPFIHAGEEFLREKLDENGKRAENSYNASDYVNHIEWSNLEKAEYKANSDYYKGLIAFRAANPALRYATAQLVADNVRNTTTEDNLLMYRVDANGTADTTDEDILVIFNANASDKTVTLPEGDWTIYVNDKKAGTEALGTASGTVKVAGISAMVLTKPDEGKDAKEPLGASSEKTLYFSNNKGWETVYAYAWTDGGETLLLGAWPGTQMTFVQENEYGEDIYSITLPASETGIEGLIISDGSGEQTVDIEPGVDGTGYYCTDKNEDGKYLVGTYTFRAPQLGSAEDYFLVGYINGTDFVGADYKFVDGKVTATFSADSYVYVVNGDNSETYMTDGYLGAVTSATLKDTAKYQSSQWDKLLIPGGEEVTITMVKNDNNTITLSYETTAKAVEDATGIQDGVTLHCWNWSFAEIEKQIPLIAKLGYTAIQTSPVQAMKEATNLSTNSVGSHWWVYYQPVDFVITTDDGNALGTKDELASMIETAHAYGIQVIVDVVANHLGNKTGNDLADKIPEYLRKDEYWHDIKTNISNWDDRYNMTQYCLTGLPDLNTSNDEIQGYVLGFLKECVDIGVDGFRFDMAKSIETPKDDASFASDFWPTVIGGAESYASEKYGKDLYMYGEVLDDAKIAISAYTEYMAVTDNGWGNHLRNMMASDDVTMSEGYYKSTPASTLVIWAESHDTFATDDKAQSSAAVTELDIHKTWALVAARADAMGLYFARPESMEQALGVASVTGWDNTEVAEVNRFHNAFDGQSETLGKAGDIAYVLRGNGGIVLVNTKDEETEVSLTGIDMADGTYTDQITGNTFTVANGKITGSIGDTGIAVVYDAGYKAELEVSVSGTASMDKTDAKPGETVTVTAEPDEGCKVDSITVKDENGNVLEVTDNGNGTFSFLFPNSDVTVEVVFKPDYKIVLGDKTSAELDQVQNLTFKANGALSKFRCLKINGSVVDPSNYTLEEGSTVVMLKESYLKTLVAGEYTITFVYTDGEAQGTFTLTEVAPPVPSEPEESIPDESEPEESIPDESEPEESIPDESKPEESVPDETEPEETKPAEKPTSPSTGDDSSIILWTMLALLSAAAAVVLISMRKRFELE